MHSQAPPALFSSVLAGHVQSKEDVEAIPTVLAPAGHAAQPRTFPAPVLYAPTAQALQDPSAP